MKQRITFFALFLFLSIQVQALDASISYASFKSGDQAYLEIYFYIVGSTVNYVPAEDSLSQASVDVIVLFSQNGSIVKYDKFTLQGPKSLKSAHFSDLQRYGLPDGEYDLEVILTDSNDSQNIKKYDTTVRIDYSKETVQQSDIQLLASNKKEEGSQSPFLKNGLLLESLPFNFYSRHSGTLSFYQEIYDTDKKIGEDFILSCIISKIENEQEKSEIIVNRRKQSSSIIPVLMQLDISKLHSGNYILRVEVRDRNKGLISQKSVAFQRSNPFFDQQEIPMEDVEIEKEFVAELTANQLEYSLRAMTPILKEADANVVNLMLKDKNLNAQRMYIFSYWAQKNPIDPKKAYGDYINVAAAVDKTFRSGFRYGFETDRGYFYLKYGQPNNMIREETEPSAPPYEIWTYHDFPKTGQSRVRFIFYNPSLAAGDFILLHSEAIGERNNPSWERDLYSSAPNQFEGTNYFEGTEVQDNMGRRAKRLFEDN